jgi:DNA-binding CsgD family transcriptional regulator
MNRQFERQRFLSYLTYRPELNEIAEHIIHDFSVNFEISTIRIGWIGEDHQMEIIAESGYNNTDGSSKANVAEIGKIYSPHEWKKSERESVGILLGRTDSPWTSNGKMYVHRLLSHDLLAGFIEVGFAEKFNGDREDFITTMDHTFQILTLYIIMEQSVSKAVNLTNDLIAYKLSVENSALTQTLALSQRQMSILRLISLNKTNRQIAIQLGFASSTIACDLTAIFIILGVSTRKQATAKIRNTLVAQFDVLAKKPSLNSNNISILENIIDIPINNQQITLSHSNK